MGGGPSDEHLVIILWFPEPKDITNEIRRRFPYIEVTYIQLQNPNPTLSTDVSEIPEEIFKSVTILVTLSSLPSDPRDAPNLRLVHLLSAGIDHVVHHPILTDSDIPVTTSSGIHGPPISEWVMMMTLATTKHFTTTYEWQKQHYFGDKRKHSLEGTDWVGKRVGIAGYGSIGRQIARTFTAFGANVIAYTASPRTTEEARKDHGYIIPHTGDPDGSFPVAWFSGTSKTAFHTFLKAKLDCLVISLPLTPATTNLFSTTEFQILKEANSNGCLLVNISRGKIVDQPALIDALNNDILRGAALDVTEPEPLPSDNALWDAKNVLITPHISALGKEFMPRSFDVLMTNLHRKEEGKEMFNLVNRKKGY